MFCTKCGTQLNEGSTFCPRCGTRASPVAAEVAAVVSPKSRLATSLVAIFLGRRVGAPPKTRTKVAKLALCVAGFACSCGFLIVTVTSGDDGPPALQWLLLGLCMLFSLLIVVWGLVDFIIAANGKSNDSQGKPIGRW